MIAGVCKRFGCLPPDPDPVWLDEFGLFVTRYVEEHYKPLDPSTDVTLETWLGKTSYPAHRQEELRQLWEENKAHIWEPRFQKVKGFMKDETYPSYKHARGINSRHDLFKCAVGPTFKAIEEVVFQDPSFIKYVPVADRGKKILERLYRVGALPFGSDYTSFEALITRVLMTKCEWILYRHMVRFLPTGKDFMKLVEEVIGGTNHIAYKLFWVFLICVRMSGEMNTSLGNGFTDLMVFLFICHKIGAKDPIAYCEGDDLLATVFGTRPTKEHFAKLGLICKPEYPDEISTASFCGIIADDVALDVVTDPIEAVCSFGWTTREYAKAGSSVVHKLLRCKALSLAHQYPGCPILASFADYVLRMTRGYDVREFAKRLRVSVWERDQILAAIKDERKLRAKQKPVHKWTRHLVEKKFGIKIEHQLMLEAHFDGLNSLGVLDHELLLMYVPAPWFDYFYNFSETVEDVRRITDHSSRAYPCIPVGAAGHVSIPPSVWVSR